MDLTRRGVCKLLLVQDSDEEALHFYRAVGGMIGEFEIVGRAASGPEAIEYLAGAGRHADRGRHPWPDVVVVAMGLPKESGMAILEWMAGKKDMPEAVIFSGSAVEGDKKRALELGAALYQQKTSEVEVIERFLRWVKRLWEVEAKQREAKRAQEL
jgi:CheY-like chemotaxis protein